MESIDDKRVKVLEEVKNDTNTYEWIQLLLKFATMDQIIEQLPAGDVNIISSFIFGNLIDDALKLVGPTPLSMYNFMEIAEMVHGSECLDEFIAKCNIEPTEEWVTYYQSYDRIDEYTPHRECMIEKLKKRLSPNVKNAN